MTFAKGFDSVAETPEFVEAVVEGKIPAWLQGSLYRVGPGKFDIKGDANNPIVTFRHWFDGLSLLHEFRIQPAGRVQYRSRFLSKEYEELIKKRNGASGESLP